MMQTLVLTLDPILLGSLTSDMIELFRNTVYVAQNSSWAIALREFLAWVGIDRCPQLRSKQIKVYRATGMLKNPILSFYMLQKI